MKPSKLKHRDLYTVSKLFDLELFFSALYLKDQLFEFVWKQNPLFFSKNFSDKHFLSFLKQSSIRQNKPMK